MAVSLNGVTSKWMVDFMEKPKIKWMRTGGTPYFRKPPYRERIFTDHTLAHPLTYRGGVVARLSA